MCPNSVELEPLESGPTKLGSLECPRRGLGSPRFSRLERGPNERPNKYHVVNGHEVGH